MGPALPPPGTTGDSETAALPKTSLFNGELFSLSVLGAGGPEGSGGRGAEPSQVPTTAPFLCGGASRIEPFLSPSVYFLQQGWLPRAKASYHK